MALRFDWHAESSGFHADCIEASMFTDHMRIDCDEAWIVLSKEDAIRLAKRVLEVYTELMP